MQLLKSDIYSVYVHGYIITLELLNRALLPFQHFVSVHFRVL